MKKIIGIAIILLTNTIYAQNVNKICENYVTKVGGIGNIKKIENFSTEQIGYSNNYEIPQNFIIVKDKAFYQETMYPNGKSTVAINKNKGWEINPFASSKPRDLTSVEIDAYMRSTNLFGPLYDYYLNGKNAKVKEIIIDSEKEIDRDLCYKLKITYKNNFIEYVYVSKTSFMVRKIENTLGTITYFNYKKTNNIMFPFNSEMKNNLGTILIDVLKFKVNVKVDYNKFNKP